MQKRKNNKRALIVSVLSLLLCVSMLVGSTMAWFTDNASTAVNTIQAGTLDIGLYDNDSTFNDETSLENKTLAFVDKDGKVMENILFEPGAKFRIQNAWLRNNGNLNAKYQVVITGIDGSSELAKVLDVFVNDINCGTLATLVAQGGIVKTNTIAPETTDTFGTIELMMQTTAGNEYQGKSLSGIAITVQATQAAVESDSYGTTYDELAEYGPQSIPKTETISSADLAALIVNAENGIVELTGDVLVYETVAISKDITLISKNDAAFVADEGFNDNVISVAENASLTIDGVNFNGIVLDSALVVGNAGAKITFKNVSVEKCTALVINANGADVVLDNGTVMTGNTFTKKSGQGGTVVNVKTGSLTINEGVVVENNTVANARDGLFAAYADAKIVMNGGKISNNVVTDGTVGSVIYVQGTNGGAATASFTMNGGEISNNQGVLASAVASRWCNGGTCSIILNAGTIKGNTTTSANWMNASVFYRCDTTIGADMVIDGVVYGDENEKNGWTLTDNRN